MKQTFFFLKTLFLKPTVSAMIFLVTIVLGFGVYAAISSLDEVKSTAAPANQLTAEKWDYLVDQVQQLEGARNTIVSQLQTIDTQIASIHQHLANLSGSATPSPLSNVWKVSGTTIYYTSGNVGIGTTNPTTKLYVNGSGYFNGNIGVKTTPLSDVAINISDYYGIRINRGYGYQADLTEQSLVISGRNKNSVSDKIHSTTIYRGEIQMGKEVSGEKGSIVIAADGYPNGGGTRIGLRSTYSNNNNYHSLSITPRSIGFSNSYSSPSISIGETMGTLSNNASCSTEGLITFARISDTESRLFVCLRNGGTTPKRRSMRGE